MDNIQKYVYLICFTGYLREQSRVAMDGASEEEKKTFALTGGKILMIQTALFVLPYCMSFSVLGKVSTPTENLKVTKTFQAWMDDHANFRTICKEGKGESGCYSIFQFATLS